MFSLEWEAKLVSCLRDGVPSSLLQHTGWQQSCRMGNVPTCGHQVGEVWLLRIARLVNRVKLRFDIRSACWTHCKRQRCFFQADSLFTGENQADWRLYLPSVPVCLIHVEKCRNFTQDFEVTPAGSPQQVIGLNTRCWPGYGDWHLPDGETVHDILSNSAILDSTCLKS